MSLRVPNDLVVIDTETTGLDPRTAYVHEIAAIHHNSGDPTAFSIRVRVPVTALLRREFFAAQRIHKVPTRTLLRDGDDPVSATRTLARFVNQYAETPGRATLAGHNIAFDAKFLQPMFKRAGKPWPFGHRWVDASTLGRFAVGESKAEDIARRIGIEPGDHSALADAWATYRSIVRLADRLTYEDAP